MIPILDTLQARLFLSSTFPPFTFSKVLKNSLFEHMWKEQPESKIYLPVGCFSAATKSSV